MSSKEGGQVDDQGAYLLNPKIMSEVAEHEKAELKNRSPVKKYLNGLVSLEDRARITVKFKLMLSQ